MKFYLIGALILALLGAVGLIYKMGGSAAKNKIELATANATIEKLREDAVSVKELQERTTNLKKRLNHAQNLYKSIKDIGGCFRKSVPRPAAVELYNMYRSFTAEAGHEALRKGEAPLSSVTAESCLVALGNQWEETDRLNGQLEVLGN